MNNGRFSRTWTLGLLFTCVSLLLFSGHLASGDGEAYFLVAFRFLTGQDPTLPAFLQGFATEGISGQLYSKFGIGLSLLLMPLLAVGISLTSLVQGGVVGGEPLRAWALLLNPIAGGIGIALLYRLMYTRFCTRKTAMIVTSIAGFSGLWLVYSRTLFSEIVVAVCFLVAVQGLYREQREGDWLLGVASALAVLVRLDAAIFLMPLVLWRLYQTRRWGAYLIPGGISGVTIGLYNMVRFGHPLSMGMGSSPVEQFSTPLVLGWYGQFFAVGNGLFVYAPYLGIATALICYLFVRGQRPNPKSIVILTGCVLFISLHGKWFSWMGGWSWGPRRMIPLFLIAHIPLAWGWKWFGRWARGLIMAGVVASIAVNLPGMVSDFNEYYRGTFYRHDVLFSPEHAQVYGQFRGIFNGSIPLDLYWLETSAPGLIVVFLLAIVSIVLLSHLTRPPGTSP